MTLRVPWPYSRRDVSTGSRAAPTRLWSQTKKISWVHLHVTGLSSPSSANKVLSWSPIDKNLSLLMKTQCREKRGKGRSHKLWKFKMFSPLVLVVATRLIFSVQMQHPCLFTSLFPLVVVFFIAGMCCTDSLARSWRWEDHPTSFKRGFLHAGGRGKGNQVLHSSSCPLRLKDQGILLWATPYLALMCKSMSFLSFKMLCKIMGHLAVYKWHMNSDQSRVNALSVTADKHLPRKSCTN